MKKQLEISSSKGKAFYGFTIIPRKWRFIKTLFDHQKDSTSKDFN